jgi:hypothetical protein
VSAAFDAVGDRSAGLRAARDDDADSTVHMDDIVATMMEIQQIMREVSYDEYVQNVVAANRQAGQVDPSQRPSNVVGLETDSDAEPSEDELESTSQFVEDKRIAMRSFDRNDAEAAAFNPGYRNDAEAPAFNPGYVESDSADDSEDEALELAEALNRPGGRANVAPADDSDDEALELAEALNQPGGRVNVAPAEPLKQLDVVAKAEAARLLRDSPGILKLLSARVFKFSDFLTNGEFDLRKLAKCAPARSQASTQRH